MRYWSRVTGQTAIVGVVGDVWIVSPVPAGTVNIVVVGIVVYLGTRQAHKWVVGRHCPYKCGPWAGVAETEELRRAIDTVVLHQIDAIQIDGHVYFLAGIGVETIQPYLIER